MKLNKNEKIKNVIMIGMVIIIFSICVIQINTNLVSEVSTNISNDKTIGWGIKRDKNHQQPDVGSENKKILEENDGICLGNNFDKIIYLTFDSGYEAGYTEKILETLKSNNVKATFFITSHYLNSASDIVEKMINDGHIIGNHIPLTLMTLI